MWLTAQTGPEAMCIGYITPVGEAFAAHGSGEGWPRIGVCSDETRALACVIGAWGEQIANSPYDG